MARIQRLAEPLWTYAPVNIPNFYIYGYAKDKKTGKSVLKSELVKDRKKEDGSFEMIAIDPDHPNKMVPATAKNICRYRVLNAQKRGLGAYAAGPIPCNENQFGVFMYANAGFTKECSKRKNDDEKVKMAYNSVFCSETKTEEKTISVETAREDVSESLVVFVWLDHQTKPDPYAYRCTQPHKKGAKITVGANEHKEVTVDHIESWTETQIKSFAKSKGYDDLEPVYREGPMTDEDYADNYVEDIDELNAMRDAFAPVGDVNIYGDALDYYIEAERDHEVPNCPEEYDDLPE